MVGLTTATVAPVCSAISRVTAARSAFCTASPDRCRYTATRLRSARTSRAASVRAPAAVPDPAACGLPAIGTIPCA